MWTTGEISALAMKKVQKTCGGCLYLYFEAEGGTISDERDISACFAKILKQKKIPIFKLARRGPSKTNLSR
jgi:hypothetical protein